MSQQALEPSTSNAPAKVNPAVLIRRKIDEYAPVIDKLLHGTGVSMETFKAQLANAYRAQPKLWNCTPETVLGASLKAAQLGLAPNDARNLCWIIPYGTEAQFQLGYGGAMELARRAAPGLRFDGHAVHPNDDFDLDYGRPQPLMHRPAVAKQMGRGGEAYAWYVRATYPDGSMQIHAIDREQVEYHRSFSKQPKGEMWTKSYDAAALKSCVLDMRRWLPSSPQLVAAVVADEQTFDVRKPDDIEVIPAAHEPIEEAA